MQVRLRIGRLTLGLTVADRWECSQATGLPAWRHQDLHTSQRKGQHSITGTQTEEHAFDAFPWGAGHGTLR